jgi:phenylpropionate dioxygenase-like ring-hydroxylating dioxygenase large terminal subunit
VLRGFQAVSAHEETGVLNHDSPRAPRVRVAGQEPPRSVNGGIPKLSGDIRHFIPKLGLRNYWYPALNARTVGSRKPVKVSMLGEDICFFRGANGDVAAIQDVCPHRGARLSEGDCHYRGTVACPYHGWVYDESGKNVAILSEGPDSGVCGKPGTEAKVYPTRSLKGLVFVWIGDEEPAPIEEDVPEEFFDADALVLTGQVYWRCNWEVALENSMDSHVNYVHRNALVVARTGFIARGAQGEHPIYVGNGFGGDVSESNYLRRNPSYDVYANGWRWPKTNYRRAWTWLLRPLAERARRNIPPPRSSRWCSGHHLPGMFRAEFAYDLYTRMCVPVEENLTRVWYYHYLRPQSALASVWQRFLYAAMHRWIIEYNFSRQDERVMLNQRYDTPEKLSGTDAEVIQWRRLVVSKHFGGRHAPFEYRNPDGMAPEDVPVSRVSVRYLQEQARAKAAAR